MAACKWCQSAIDSEAVFCPHCDGLVENAVENEDYEYEAFISYRHIPRDTEIARQIQRHIEGFRIPRELQTAERGRRLGRLFRDEDELPTSSSLSTQIRSAIKRSRFLVVVCSPEMRESLWVAQEVELFASFHGRDRILVALSDKEPSDSLPELLLQRKVVADDGTISVEPSEPLAADFRVKEKYKVESQRIVAAILGCGYDDLRQRLKMRRMRIGSAFALAIGAIMMAFGSFAVYQQVQIDQNYRSTQINESRLLTEKADGLLDRGDRYGAVEAALAALPKSSTSNDRPFIPSAQVALEAAVGVHPELAKWTGCYLEEDVYDRRSCYASDQGVMAVVTEYGDIEVRELPAGNLVLRMNLNDALGVDVSGTDEIAMAFADGCVVLARSNELFCLDYSSGNLLWRAKAPCYVRSDNMAVSPDGKLVAFSGDDVFGREIVCVMHTSDGSEYRSFSLECPDYIHDLSLCFSPAGERLAIGFGNSVYQVGLESKTLAQKELHYGRARKVEYVGEYLTVVAEDPDGIGFANTHKYSLEVYDKDLQYLWKRTDSLTPMFSADHKMYGVWIGACGTWCYDQAGGTQSAEDAEQLVVVSGKDLLLLDSKTGKEVFRETFRVPLCSCAVVSGNSGGHIILATMYDGGVALRIPQKGSDSDSLAVYDDELERFYRADIIECGGTWVLSTWSTDSARHVVYRWLKASDLVAAQRFEELDGWQTAGGGMTSEGFLYLSGEEGLSVFRYESGLPELKWTKKWSSFESLRMEAERKPLTLLASSGSRNMYVYQAMKSEDDSATTNLVVYVLDAEDGSVKSMLTVSELPEVYEVSEAFNRDSGKATLLLEGSKELTVVDVESGTVQRCFVREKLEDSEAETGATAGYGREAITSEMLSNSSIKDAVLAGQNLIVCQEVIEGVSVEPPLSIKLANWVTGELVDAEICRYARPRRGIASLSNDDSLYVMTCTDGKTRLFDTATGSMVWETDAVPPKVNCLRILGAGDVFYQATSGECGLISGATGKLKCTSDQRLPELREECFYREEDNTLLVFFKRYFPSPQMGIALVSLNESSFGPISVVEEGLTMSVNRDSVLVFPNTAQKVYVAPLFTLDELIERGRMMLSAFNTPSSKG